MTKEKDGLSLEEAKKIVALDKEQKEKETDLRINKWIDSKIGSTWVYRNNSYGSDSERWDVFMKIISSGGNRNALVETWELRENGILEIHRETRYLYREEEFLGYVECSAKDFDSYKKNILNILCLTELKDGSTK